MTVDDPTIAPTTKPRRRGPPLRGKGAAWTWLVVGVVFAVVGTIVLFKAAGSPVEAQRITSLTLTGPTVLAEVTAIPQSVYDAVGVTSEAVPVVAPTTTPAGTARLELRTTSGRRLPGVLYVGTEYCSFCAAERWGLIAALSRFGSFRTLYDMTSSELDFAPGTPTFTFYGTSYRSALLVFRGYETQSDVATRNGHRRLMVVPRHVRDVLHAFDAGTSYPFVDVGGVAVALRAGFSPQTLAGLSRERIAEKLDDPTNPVTRAIVSTANFLSAAICASVRKPPASVCTSAGVRAAASAMRL
jgi:Domain of unknown function (DUF929)